MAAVIFFKIHFQFTKENYRKDFGNYVSIIKRLSQLANPKFSNNPAIKLLLKATANHPSPAYEPCMHPRRHPSFCIEKTLLHDMMTKKKAPQL